MAHYTLIARINAGNGRFPFVNVQFTKTHRPIPRRSRCNVTLGRKPEKRKCPEGLHRVNTAFTNAVLPLATSPNEGQQD